MALDFSEERTIKWIAEFGLYNIVRYPNCDHGVAKVLAADYLSVVEILQKKCHLKYAHGNKIGQGVDLKWKEVLKSYVSSLQQHQTQELTLSIG